MKLIKLDAIDSTNEFLKRLSSEEELENFTVVTAEKQFNGKGQMGAKWESESGKNLIMSVLVKDFSFVEKSVFNLNVVVSLAVIRSLKKHDVPELSVKWPNDIMSANKKIGGILIENSFRGSRAISSVVGLGLNVNQLDFELLPRASSMAKVCNSFFDKELILSEIVSELEQLANIYEQTSTQLWEEYRTELFKIGVPAAFSDINNDNFMGIIKGVTAEGKLELLLEDDSVCQYNLKEVQLLY